MNPISWLLLAHFIADFPLQGDFLANMKGKNWFLMCVHVLIYTLTISAMLTLLGIYEPWKYFLVGFSHLVIDYWKCHFADKETALTTSLYIDQALHVAVLWLIYCL